MTMEYDINFTVEYGERTNAQDYDSLLRDLEDYGMIVDSDMGAYGYRVYVETDMGGKEFRKELVDLARDYGLELQHLYDEKGYVYP